MLQSEAGCFGLERAGEIEYWDEINFHWTEGVTKTAGSAILVTNGVGEARESTSNLVDTEMTSRYRSGEKTKLGLITLANGKRLLRIRHIDRDGIRISCSVAE